MNAIIFVLLTVFTLANISSYFVGLYNTPAYTIFTGAVHYPLDYLYYLSFIVQGKMHFLRSANLNSGETTNLEFVNWVYVLFGRVGSWLHMDVAFVYQVMVIVASLLYLVVAYKLLSILLAKHTHVRLLAYVLFLLSNAFPRIYLEGGRWVYAYFYPFNNFGHPFIRLTNVPHQIFIQAAIMGVFALVITYWQKQRSQTLLYTFVVGFLLASMQPLQWAFATVVSGVIGVLIWYRKKDIRASLPVLILCVAGLAPALYLRHLYRMPPYEFTLRWESWQQIRISFVHFITLNGPLMVVALIGLPYVIRKGTMGSWTILLSGVCAIAIFFSTLPQKLGILNVRFLSVIPTLAMAYISAAFLWDVAYVIRPKYQKTIAWILAGMIIVITLPVTIRQLYERTMLPADNVYIYMPMGMFQAFDYAKGVVATTETVLVDPLFAAQFTAFTGKHVFVSNMFATVDYDRKIKEAAHFLYEQGSPEEKANWLVKNNISYIISYAWSPITLPNVTELYKNLFAAVYKVHEKK